MNALIFVTKGYSIGYTLKEGFEKAGWEAEILDFTSFFSAIENNLFLKLSGLPRLFQRHWYTAFIRRINESYFLYIKQRKPELIVIFNHQFFSPDTLNKIKEITKIVFYLGDSPLLSQTYDLNLKILEYGDYIISPDSYWVEQLKIIGIKNIYFELIGFNENIYYPFTPSPEDLEKFKSEVSYIGVNYNNSSGYKKTLFLSKFASFDLKIYATGIKTWQKWAVYFPELKNKLIPHDNHDQKFNNLIQNCSKIYPVDANHVVINGIHVRILDCIGSGILPVVEYRKDVTTIFGNTGLPIINNYNEAADVVSYYLKNETMRLELVRSLREFVLKNYPMEALIRKVQQKMSIS